MTATRPESADIARPIEDGAKGIVLQGWKTITLVSDMRAVSVSIAVAFEIFIFYIYYCFL